MLRSGLATQTMRRTVRSVTSPKHDEISPYAVSRPRKLPMGPTNCFAPQSRPGPAPQTGFGLPPTHTLADAVHTAPRYKRHSPRNPPHHSFVRLSTLAAVFLINLQAIAPVRLLCGIRNAVPRVLQGHASDVVPARRVVSEDRGKIANPHYCWQTCCPAIAWRRAEVT